MNESSADLRIVPLPAGHDAPTDLLRHDARRMLAQAGAAEVAASIAAPAHAHLTAQAGRRQVARDGHLPGQAPRTGLGEVEPPGRRPAGCCGHPLTARG